MVDTRITERQRAVDAVKECGGDISKAAKRIGHKRAYVQRWWDTYIATGSLDDQARVGRPPKLSKVNARKARVLAAHRIKSTCNKIADKLFASGSTPTRVSRRTVNRALHEGKKRLTYSTQANTKVLPPSTMKKRLIFCQKHRDQGWKNVLVLDSKVFPLDDQGRVKEWHYEGTKKNTSAIKEKRKLHAYGAACVRGVTSLRFVTGSTGIKKKYHNKRGKLLDGVGHKEFIDVLKDTIIPEGKKLFNGVPFSILMDRAPAHTPVEVEAVLKDEGITCIQGWPGHSPDLNWIENLWGIMENQLKGRSFRSLQAWKLAVEQEWRSIPKETLKKCASSMRGRMRRCIKEKGGHIGC